VRDTAHAPVNGVIGVMPMLAATFAVSCALTWTLSIGRARALALDEPNQRSLHQRPVPRAGGVAIVAATVAAWLFLKAPVHASVMGAFVALCGLSFIDDLRSLPVSFRLMAHIAAAAVTIAALQPGLPLLMWLAALLGIAWMVNLYNFMDGSDGLAGGMAVIGFAFYGCAAWIGGDSIFAAANWAVSAAAAGFLVFNFHPARIFMGDSGSVPLGFIAAAFGLHGWAQQEWPWWFPLMGVYALGADNDAQTIILGTVAMLYMLAMLAVDAAWRTIAGPAE
jgi:UDP-N-acetylmuramyl pentapeptide phosphotransferase/UDP-N-acetylglucosamine-1-phosphate transferase